MTKTFRKSIDTLETWDLGNLCLIEFLVKDIESLAKEGRLRKRLRLERMDRVLRNRDFKERLTVYRRIKYYYEKAVSYEHYELAEALQNILDYYHAHILD